MSAYSVSPTGLVTEHRSSRAAMWIKKEADGSHYIYDKDSSGNEWMIARVPADHIVCFHEPVIRKVPITSRLVASDALELVSRSIRSFTNYTDAKRLRVIKNELADFDCRSETWKS